MHQFDLFKDRNGLAPRLREFSRYPAYSSQSFPVTERLASTSLWFTTSVLMGSREDARDVVRALEKVLQSPDQLAKVDGVEY